MSYRERCESPRGLILAVVLALGTCGCQPTIYWTEFNGGTINAAASGSMTSQVLASHAADPGAIAVEGSYVYWVDPGNGTVNRISTAGGTPSVLASGLTGPMGITVDADTVFFTNTGDGTIQSVPVAGGTPTVLASWQLDPIGIAADANNLYWANAGGGTIMTCQKIACQPMSLFIGGSWTRPAMPWGIGVDATNVYWTDAIEWTVNQIPINSNGVGTPTVLADVNGANSSAAFANPSGIAVDSKFVYWVNTGGGGAINQVPIGGGPAQQVVASGAVAFSLAVTASNIYWASYATNAIEWVPKACGGSCAVTRIQTATPPQYVTVQ